MSTQLYVPSGADYAEARQHELRKTRMVMVDGSLTANGSSSEGGSSARVFNNGYWGFASAPLLNDAGARKVAEQALANARTMGRFGGQAALSLPAHSHRGEYGYNGRPPMPQQDCVQLLEELNAWCSRKYPKLKSTAFFLMEEAHEKRLATSTGSECLATINRGVFYVRFAAEDQQGRPVELMEAFSARGSLQDLNLSVANLEAELDVIHGHLMAKCQAVAPRGGKQTVILAPPLAGMLAHEAMGHPCEADLVLGGAVTGKLVGQQVASELVSMVDLAHSFRGEELMTPVYVDDEGVQARDVTLIDQGVLRDFMSSRETAARLGLEPSGNARAYTFNDEPLVRMRNTAILPGSSTLDEMIAGVDDGYYLMRSGNGEADSTTEFMFGITLGYEIKNGKLGRAITDTTVSGTAIDMLKTVNAVSDDMYWECNGYCGKKQPMVVSMGGPALRAQVHMGGE